MHISKYSSYITDDLMKYQCCSCKRKFILSVYQAETFTKEHDKDIKCPYCGSKDIEGIVWLDDEDLLDRLGCMGIGHYPAKGEEESGD